MPCVAGVCCSRLVFQRNRAAYRSGKIPAGAGFEEIRSNPEMFRSIRVGEGRTICWKNGADIDPDTLYHQLTPAWTEEKELKLAK
jgi:hypothetical protein